MRTFIDITKALADETRVRTLLALRGGELCVCQITELFGLAASTVSAHLAVLHRAGLVASRKEGRWIYYRRPGKEAPAAAKEALRWVERAVGKAPQASADEARLKRIQAIDPIELCKRQCQK